jgi:large subunit ribosomal protein L29
MGILKPDEIRNMSPEERTQKFRELKRELLKERGTVKKGGAPTNPGKIRALRRQIARVLTIEKEFKRGD